MLHYKVQSFTEDLVEAEQFKLLSDAEFWHVAPNYELQPIEGGLREETPSQCNGQCKTHSDS